MKASAVVDHLYVNERKELFATSAEMILTEFLKVKVLLTERDSNNSAAESQLIPMRPNQTCSIRLR